MEKYTSIIKSNVSVEDTTKKTMEKIRKNFFNTYKVDLDQYTSVCENIGDRWKMIMQNIPALRGETQFDNSGLPQADLAIWTLMSDINSTEKDFEALKKMPAFYEPDIWINAYFNIKYLEKKGEKSKEFDSALSHTILTEEDGTEKDLPFDEEDLKMVFCNEIKKYLLNRGSTRYFFKLHEPIGSVIDDENTVKEEKSKKVSKLKCSNKAKGAFRLELRYPNNDDFRRYSFPNMKKMVEECGTFPLEDQILFYKLSNFILAENAVYEFFQYGEELCDYRLELYQIGKIHSFNWQLALMRFFIEYDTNFYSIIVNLVPQLKTGEDPFTTAANNTLIGKNCVDEWISDPSKINNYMRILTEGLIYLYETSQNKDKILQEIESKASKYLDKFLGKTDEIEKLMESTDIYLDDEENKKTEADVKELSRDDKKLRLGKTEEYDKNLFYMYAQLQMELIRYCPRPAPADSPIHIF